MSPGAVLRSGGRTCQSDRCYWKPGLALSQGSSRGSDEKVPAYNNSQQHPKDAPRHFGEDELHSSQGGTRRGQHSHHSSAQQPGDPLDNQHGTRLGTSNSQRLGLRHDFEGKGDVSSIAFTFLSWCNSLTRKVLSSRTKFAHFLSRTLYLSRDGPSALPTALFPLPLPNTWAVALGPEASSKCSKRDEAVSRALHVVVSALNYVFFSKGYPPLDLLRRQPNEIQARAISHLRLLIESCDRKQPTVIAASGRRNLLLMARLKELALAADALGLSSYPYAETKSQVSVKVNNTEHPQLQPFSNLVPERLKISGRGQWDGSAFIEPEFYMAFQEPQSIELDRPVPDRGTPNFEVDTSETVFKLFQRWDDLGLLALHPVDHITTGESGRVKIFNAFKSAEHDRQIGDRRERNSWEARIPGPSSRLPVGALIGRLCIPDGCGVKLCVTDRSDYYHQVGVSLERSRTNIVWPPMPLKDFTRLKAYQDYCSRAAGNAKPIDRTVHGDHLEGHRPRSWPLDDSTMVYGAFKAILQGDHLGVEFGISAHVGLLQSVGLLPDQGRLVTDALIRPCGLYQGLCIDDYFVIAKVPAAELESITAPKSAARVAFDAAKRCYQKAGLQGSDAKDIIDASLGTVVGAEINSQKTMVEQGILPVAAPAAKRLALSWIALEVSFLPCTSDALHSSLVGGLVSAFCYRRCTMSILNEVFKVISPTELSPEDPKLRKLSRAAADELVLSAVLLPVIASDIKMPFHEWTYASDASTQKGAFCETKLPRQVSVPMWLSGDFKGAFSCLDPWQKILLERAGECDHEEWNELHPELPQGESQQPERPARPLAQYFDFLEVCGGSGVISDQIALQGYVVGPIIDLSFSPQYDLVQSRVIEWLLFMVQNRRVRAIALEPPCTTFSAAAHPACRSYNIPRGWNQKSSKVWFGNRLAFACLTILWAAAYSFVLGLLETPRRSKMAWLKEWLFLLSLPNVQETYTASCSYGSPFQKEFRFLTCNMRPDSICKPCTRDHEHTVIQGQLTKGSSVYCPGLAKALADLFARHLEVEKEFTTKNSLRASGLESPLVNEVLKRSSWKTSSSWKWTGNSHINVLELASAFQSIKRSALRGGGRTCLLLDSNVCVRAIAKGRSSSRALTPLLRKIMAVCIAFQIALSILFAPTRLNIADDPTRSTSLRSPHEGPSFLAEMSDEEVFKLAELPPSRRWISNWTALFLGLCLHHNLRFAALSIPNPRFRSSHPPMDLYHFMLDFDSTLGFPGEGPFRFLLDLVLGWILFSFRNAMAMDPRNRDDERRAAFRRSRPLLPGRPVEEVTRSNRQLLLEKFQTWLREQGISYEVLMKGSQQEPEKVVNCLVEYGQTLYKAGRPYSHFSETINAVAASRPTLRRLLTGAWDLAFSWLREEPGEHHVACPFQIMLALLSLAILWGWPTVAGIISLSWGAVCRIGEVLASLRKDLILPADVGYTSNAVFLRVQEPKTRYRAARHQMTRLEYEDLVQLISTAFGKMQPWQRLWPHSAQLLRNRFRQLLGGIGLPTERSGDSRCLDLGSLRAGGATFLLMVTEDAELVRRRGRWLAHRTMEIYLQEAAATVYFPTLPSAIKSRILHLAAAFPTLLSQMQHFDRIQVPPETWYCLFQMETDGRDGKILGRSAKDQKIPMATEQHARIGREKEGVSSWH